MEYKEDFEKIYDDTYPILLKYAVLKCDNISNVEDILQNVYLKVYKLLPKKGVEYFNIKILIKLTKNELFRYYTLKNKVKEIFYNEDISYLENSLVVTNNIENNIEIKMDLEEAWKMILNEDINTQKIATLYFLNDMTIKDISEFMNLNLNTVKSKLYRLINKLKGERRKNNNED